MASQPDILITIPVDPAGAQDYKPALDAGITMAFYDNPVEGWSAGNQYVDHRTGDHYRMGKAAADLLAEAIGGPAPTGSSSSTSMFYNSQQPGEGVPGRDGAASPGHQERRLGGVHRRTTVSAAADAMLTQHPDLDGIYVSYSGAATGVFASLAAANNTHIKVVTFDLDAANDVVMATAGSNYYGTAIEQTSMRGQHRQGRGAQRCGGTVPPFIVVPPLA